MGHEKPQDYSDHDMGTIYDTDMVVVYPTMVPYGGAVLGGGGFADYGIRCNAVGEGVVSYILIDDKVDTTRDMKVKWTWTREDAGGDSIDGMRTIHARPVDGSAAAWTNKDTDITIDLDGCGLNRGEMYEWILEAANITEGWEYKFILNINEAAKDITITSIMIRYYQKRLLS